MKGGQNLSSSTAGQWESRMSEPPLTTKQKHMACLLRTPVILNECVKSGFVFGMDEERVCVIYTKRMCEWIKGGDQTSGTWTFVFWKSLYNSESAWRINTTPPPPPAPQTSPPHRWVWIYKLTSQLFNSQIHSWFHSDIQVSRSKMVSYISLLNYSQITFLIAVIKKSCVSTVIISAWLWFFSVI